MLKLTFINRLTEIYPRTDTRDRNNANNWGQFITCKLLRAVRTTSELKLYLERQWTVKRYTTYRSVPQLPSWQLASYFMADLQTNDSQSECRKKKRKENSNLERVIEERCCWKVYTGSRPPTYIVQTQFVWYWWRASPRELHIQLT